MRTSFFLLSATLACWAVEAAGQQERPTIPSVTGLSRMEAISALTRAGLRFQLGYASSCSLPKDVISNQQPASGTPLEKDQVVIILENTTGGFKMPQLIGQPYETAEGTARALGMGVALDQSQVRLYGGTCGNPSETWTGVETQDPPAGADVCLQSPGTVSLSRTKLKEKIRGGRMCDPDWCGPRRCPK